MNAIPLRVCAVCALLSSACSDDPNAVVIPDGIVLVTKEQTEFVSLLTTLQLGMSPDQVEGKLGIPNEAREDFLYYWIDESRLLGGHYITARLQFSESRLSSAVVGFGHIIKRPAAPKPQ